jgi:hypothetical protein
MTYQKKLDEAPYHPGYEDAVVPPAPKYTGMNPSKMLWKSKPLTDEEIIAVGNAVVNHIDSNEGWIEFARAIEERHGIK